MKNAPTRLSARYLSALRTHLRAAGAKGSIHARNFGRAALAGGLETRDLTRMHAQAIRTLAAANELGTSDQAPIRRAGYFFAQVLVPFEAVDTAMHADNRRLQRRNEQLSLRTAALESGNRRLEREITRRKAGEVVIRQGKEQYQKLFFESQLMQRKLRKVTRQIISAQEEERKVISRELHDEVVQTLVGINVQLSALSKGASVGLDTLKEKIICTQKLVENSVNAVHRFARELRPVVLDHLGLIPALHAYSKSLAERKKIRIRLTAFGGVEALGSAKRTVLYRVAQEALTNVARHAQATQVSVSISEASGAIRMEISDNGKSFPVEETLLGRNNKRLGLVGMKERIEMVGGQMTIESAPGQGTTVRAEIPFNRERTRK